MVSGSPGSGIGIQSANDGTGSVLLHDNVIYGTEFSAGIQVGPRAAHRIYNNSVHQAFYGIVVQPGLARVYQNTLTNNRIGLAISNYSGFGETPAGTPVISRNNLIGNIGSGVVVLPSATTGATLRENNLFGNGVCGLAGNGVVKIDARNNFWGAPTGPSFTQPADPICDDTNVRYQPFSTREFSIR